MSISLCLFWRGGGIKNNPQPKTSDWSATGGGYGGISQKKPKSRGVCGVKSHPQPNITKHTCVTKDDLCGPHFPTMILY